MIYYIQRGEDGPIKIGTSNDPERRLAELQTGSGEPLRLLAVIPGDRSLERQIHSALRDHQGIGEWFKPSPAELEYLQRLMKVEYEVVDGKAYAVLHRETQGAVTERCPFCWTPHRHGIPDGHRVPHCVGGWESIVAADGTVLQRADGYIAKTRRPEPAADA